VLGIYPRGEREVFRVTATDGGSTLCCGEHLWQVATPEDKRRHRTRVVETQEMLGNLRRAHAHRYELPVMAPTNPDEQPVPMDPYGLGLLLGDGCITTSTTPSFSTSDPELAGRLQVALEDLGVEVWHKSGYDYVLRRLGGGGRGGVITANPVTAVVRELGLAGTRSSTKFVPRAYLENSFDVRLAVLQGLLDTDGGPVTQDGRTCRVQYTTPSPQLRDDVMFLVRSLGGIATTRTRAAAGREPGFAGGRPVGHVNDAYTLDIRLPAGVQPFRLVRKRDTYQAATGGRPMRYVESIEPAGVRDTMCIQVAAEDSLYVTDDFLVTHNTLNDAFIILDEAQNTSPEQMKMFLTRLGFGSKIVVTGDVTQVDLPSGIKSGLRVVEEILDGVEDLSFNRLTSNDVVRHRLVGKIVAAYEEFDERRQRDPRAQGHR
jgi:phosphate starvation-inducible PhoH-like protein